MLPNKASLNILSVRMSVCPASTSFQISTKFGMNTEVDERYTTVCRMT